MTTNAYIISWCCDGLESVVPITEYEQWDRDNVWRILNNQEHIVNPINSIMQRLLLRARYNTQRRYEIYAVDCAEEITKESLIKQFDDNPQGMADLIRSRGHKLYSDRANPVIT